VKRRSFFTSLAKAAAIIALAPQLAFRVKPIEWTRSDEGIMKTVAFWNQTERYTACVDAAYEKAMAKVFR